VYLKRCTTTQKPLKIDEGLPAIIEEPEKNRHFFLYQCWLVLPSVIALESKTKPFSRDTSISLAFAASCCIGITDYLSDSSLAISGSEVGRTSTPSRRRISECALLTGMPTHPSRITPLSIKIIPECTRHVRSKSIYWQGPSLNALVSAESLTWTVFSLYFLGFKVAFSIAYVPSSLS